MSRMLPPSTDSDILAAIATIVDENNQFDLGALGELLCPGEQNHRYHAWHVARARYADLVRRATNAATFQGRGLAGWCVDNQLPAPLHRTRLSQKTLLSELQKIGQARR